MSSCQPATRHVIKCNYDPGPLVEEPADHRLRRAELPPPCGAHPPCDAESLGALALTVPDAAADAAAALAT